ncbi:MAG TPA: FAD-binding oxidoreductase, partial [Candidatus Spyradosoma merdigallinarum]|nr:FAD-binding oxidoreductase [Candidatus Spyradosoma merdigallinarum]
MENVSQRENSRAAGTPMPASLFRRLARAVFGAKAPAAAEDALDFVVVGQGLAGTLLALELEKRGRRVLVVDDGWKTAASRAAAGVLNP